MSNKTVSPNVSVVFFLYLLRSVVAISVGDKGRYQVLTKLIVKKSCLLSQTLLIFFFRISTVYSWFVTCIVSLVRVFKGNNNSTCSALIIFLITL